MSVSQRCYPSRYGYRLQTRCVQGTSRPSGQTVDDLRVSPAKRRKCASQFAEQKITPSMYYTNKPLFCRRFASINAMTRWNTQSAFAIPKGNTLNLHLSFCVTKAVLSLSFSVTRICQYALCISHTVMNLALPTVSMCASALGVRH